MITAYNYFRRLRELKNNPGNQISLKENFHEIFHELPLESRSLIEKIVEDKIVDDAETAQIRKYIYRNGDPNGYDIRLLFEIHDHVCENTNSPLWNELFLNETGKYFSAGLTATRKLPLVKAAMLFDLVKNTLKGVGMMSDIELVLIKTLIETTGDKIFENKSESQFISDLFDEIVKDRKLDEYEVGILKEMIYQDNPPLKEDLDLLFEINTAIYGKPRNDVWQELFVASLSLYVLINAPPIDKVKALWLETKLESTVERHHSLTFEEIELLRTLKNQSHTFPHGLDVFWVKYCQ